MNVIYRIVFGKRYRKDIRNLQKSNRDLSALEEVVRLLSRGELLAEKHRDHPLKGKLAGTRECHIGNDWILRYVKDHERLLLLLISTGDHRRVLGIE